MRNFAATRRRAFAPQIVGAQPQNLRPTFGSTLLLPAGLTENRVLGRTEGNPGSIVVDYALGGPSQGGQVHMVGTPGEFNIALSAVAQTTTHDIIVITADFTVTVTKSLPPRPNATSKCDIVSLAVWNGTFGKTHGQRVAQNETGLATLTRELIWDGTLPFPGTCAGGIPKGGWAMFDTGSINSVFSDRASGYRFIGIKFRPHPSESRVGGYFITIGSTAANQNTQAREPSGIIFDRCVIDGGTTQMKGGLVLSCRNSAVIGCWIGNLFSFNVDRLANFAGLPQYCNPPTNTQVDQRRWSWADVVGIIVTNSSGNVLIDNNYIDSSGENVFVGGTGQNIGRNIQNIVMRRNWIRKDQATYEALAVAQPSGTVNDITAKNLWECKNGLYMVVEDNVMENSFDRHGGGQNGGAWVPKNNSYGSPNFDPESGHILFRGNWVKDFQIALAPLGFTSADDGSAVASLYCREVHVVDNLFTAWNGQPYGSPRIYQQSDQFGRVYWKHNTVYAANSLTDGKVILFNNNMTTPTVPVDELNWDDNIQSWGEWGTNGGVGRGGGPNGQAALDAVCTTYTFSGNAFMRGVSGTPTGYPAGNVYLAAWTDIYDSADIASETFNPKASWADRLASDGWTKGISDWSYFASRISGVNT